MVTNNFTGKILIKILIFRLLYQLLLRNTTNGNKQIFI